MGPLIAISAGDPVGVGPEICARALADFDGPGSAVLFGNRDSLGKAARLAAVDSSSLQALESAAVPAPGRIGLVHCGPDCPAPQAVGVESARIQLASLEKASQAVLAGRCDLLVTAPVSKASISSILPGFRGHTEYLARICEMNTDEVTMVFVSEELSVGLISTHHPMREVPDTITAERCERTALHLSEIVSALKPGRLPRLALAALNPHAGENGLLGDEERTVLAPCAERLARESGLDISGPLPADSAFRAAANGRFDAVIAAYHDQAMIPLKLAGIGRSVNVTAGLPFVRTSPDHGVAYDVAGSGRAESAGMKLAIEIAVRIWLARFSAGDRNDRS
ncbi:MAG: 4-hydroxythreonine-4-phosphate dehydrogenase PdxA [Polyangia bacterium]